MNNAERIAALRRCSYTTVAGADREDGYCKPCAYFAEDASDITCIDRMMIDAADALEAAEQQIAELMPKEGEWIATSAEVDGSRFTGERCSRCGWWKSMGIYHYCPNCGARMQTVTDCNTLEEGERC